MIDPTPELRGELLVAVVGLLLALAGLAALLIAII